MWVFLIIFALYRDPRRSWVKENLFVTFFWWVAFEFFGLYCQCAAEILSHKWQIFVLANTYLGETRSYLLLAAASFLEEEEILK